MCVVALSPLSSFSLCRVPCAVWVCALRLSLLRSALLRAQRRSVSPRPSARLRHLRGRSVSRRRLSRAAEQQQGEGGSIRS